MLKFIAIFAVTSFTEAQRNVYMENNAMQRPRLFGDLFDDDVGFGLPNGLAEGALRRRNPVPGFVAPRRPGSELVIPAR